jgi:heat shock protein HslJ
MRGPLVVLAALALASAGCNITGIPVDPSESPHAGGAPEGTWRLVQGTTPDGTIGPTRRSPITLRFRNGRGVGRAVCNSYGGRARIKGESIHFGEIVSTLMLCDGQRDGVNEGAYLSALRRVNQLRLRGEHTLVLTGRDTKLTFRRIGSAVED